mmetsp:Transcript_47399/g.119385  ORF Transcript_47399/g.119385 Transcript_47399/m.119385 type:complete len:626 (+) Transcript_47399:129-2006(+)|eukprot:CAMPEP_0177656312 /NCGR_PEP_ID=MMETSP0447-20121125/15489_1 /TAXON_ID=0 /ORGANISM="Stygamoeba regulata, Strain BSH-02190019" /LENGTH=625 /DNA_ID=CAMNT_0019160401 /DNA_START=52 /DNA_END=1929 /DNA_ORIENTATION=+
MADSTPFLKRLEMDAKAFEDVMIGRFFWAPSFEVYGGSRGLYDLGPSAAAIQNNLLGFWRQHFVLGESMLEVETTVLTPEEVLITSEHVTKFKDYMVRDMVTDDCHRADHLLEDALDVLLEKAALGSAEHTAMTVARNSADAFSREELDAQLRKYNVVAPGTGNDLSEVFDFNLMFPTQLGPQGDRLAYLRPETAQGIFMNFRRLMAEAGDQLPFAATHIGRAFRNEISPREKLLRVREFTMAEIEHFCDPQDKSHPRFVEVAELVLPLWPRESQEPSDPSVSPNNCPTLIELGTALEQKVVGNQTLAYFMGRVFEFLVKCGVRKEHMRFRQHLSTEMAHYSDDCWDAELLTSHGWKECIGIADRSCFDLTRHQEATKKSMMFFKKFDEPIVVEGLGAFPVKGVIGKAFGRAGKAIMTYLDGLDGAAAEKLRDGFKDGPAKVTIENNEYELLSTMVEFKPKKEKKTGDWLVPSVIEPSFGIGRILYCLLEQSFYARPEDAKRTLLRLSPILAPVKCSVLPLMKQDKFMPPVTEIFQILRKAGISAKVDSTSAAIGRRYARTDEIGIPFGITVDHVTLEDQTVTLRERDSTKQVRIPIADLVENITGMIDLNITWADVTAKYPAHE